MTKLPPMTPPRLRPRRRVRKRTILLGLVGVLVAVLVGGYIYFATSTSSMIRDAKDEADRLDPGWTLDALEAKREVIPDAENSAIQIERVLTLLPMGWPIVPRIASATAPTGFVVGEHILSRMSDVPPNVRLGVALAAEAQSELEKVQPAVIEARKLADMPRGRFTVFHAQNPIMTLLPHAQNVRNVGRLLQADAMRRAHDGDIDGALESCRAILNAARSLGDEPFAISQLVRIAIGSTAALTIERVLAQGEASEAALAKVQALLAQEAASSPILVAIRGERAGSSLLMEKLISGEVDLNSLMGATGTNFASRIPFTGSFYRYNYAYMLDSLNKAVEISKRPDPEHLKAWKEWELSTRAPDQFLVRLLRALNQLLLPAMKAIDDAHLRYHGTLASTMSIVAAERHRLAHGRPPASFDAIDPKFAVGLIGDPFVGGPVKFRVEPDRIVIYTVNLDATDDGGKVGKKRFLISPGTDLCMTWWQPRERRKPATDELPKNVFQTPGRKDRDESEQVP
jgi:hypothetical protein